MPEDDVFRNTSFTRIYNYFFFLIQLYSSILFFDILKISYYLLRKKRSIFSEEFSKAVLYSQVHESYK